MPPILAVALLILVYLTVLELWHEDDLEFLWKAFWVLFVFLGHVFGYAHLQGLAGAPPARQQEPLAVPRTRCSRADLERQLERKQVLAAQVEPGDPLDALEPLAHGVGVDVEGARALGDAAARAQEALERLDQLRVAAPVVRRSARSTACP